MSGAAKEAARALTAGRGGGAGAGVGRAYAPANIALVKYWGKRDEALNLPVTDSLSVSLGELGSRVELRRGEGERDRVWLNGAELGAETRFVRRAAAWLDLVRPEGWVFEMRAENTVPTAAGFASSASGFAALAKAADGLFGWGLEAGELSVLARLGSGSAARSLWDGFVRWRAGEREDGMDSRGEPLAERWEELRVGAVTVCGAEKPVGSREGMRRTVETCAFYREWPGVVARDLARLEGAIRARDLQALGETAEGNALAMHALMAATRPAIVYALPGTVEAMRKVWAARAEGVGVWLTMDAGPNVKLLFEAREEQAVRGWFGDSLRVVRPWG